MSAAVPTLADAYRHCRRVASAHYENFTVGSFLLPRRLRDHLAAIYAYARAADDVADEGTMPAAERLARLDAWEAALDDAYAGRATDPVFVALADTVRRFDIPSEPLRRLLQAFRRDVEWPGFADDEELLAYCRCSADPVGHLVLCLFGHRDAERQHLAGRICTGLQLANLWQDLSVDVPRGRVYLPRATLERFGCDPAAVARGEDSPALRRCVAAEVERARGLLVEGRALAGLVDGRLGREVRLFAAGGLAILDKIDAVGHATMVTRPVLTRRERLGLLLGAALPSRPRPRGTHTRAVREAYAHCRGITRRSRSNFAYAFFLLDAERRAVLEAVYAFCRFVDDVADEAGRQDPAGLLGRWRTELDAVYDGRPTHPIGVALADAVHRFPLARRHFHELIDGVEQDLHAARYETFADLEQYCYRVASAVGLLCIEIFGYRQASARTYARELGIACQLTNILRDVTEDAQRGRIYLPLADLRSYDVTEAELLAGRWSPRVAALMAFECGRARSFYLRAQGALAPEDGASLAVAEAMRAIYSRLLDRIERRHFDVFAGRVRLRRSEQLARALAGWGRAQLGAYVA